MKNIEIVSKVVSRGGEALVSPSKGISTGNLSDYLLKSIWDKVFEIRTDSQGTEYIFGKVPVVTQYGITMYSGDGVDVPSLASGLPFDGRTIWYNPDTQQIEVIGGGSGGGGTADSVAWANITGKPTWIGSSKPTYSYSEITGAISTTELQNYLTSNSYLNVTSGDNRYLQLSGGTLTSTLTISTGNDKKLILNNTDSDTNFSRIDFQQNGVSVGQLGIQSVGTTYLSWTGDGGNHRLLHAGNIGSYNAGSATKLQTARTIWGQSFDGTGNVSGALSDVTGITFKDDYYGLVIDSFGNFSFKKPYSTAAVDWSFKDSSGKKLMIINNNGNVGIGTTTPKSRLSAYAGVGERPSLGNLGQINTVEIGTAGEYGTYFWTEGSGSGFIQQGRTDGNATAYNLNLQVLGGNVGIGTASPQQKLHIVGNIWSSGDVGAGAKIHAFGNLIANGRAGIGLENPTTKLHVLESSTHTAAKFETYATQSALTITKRDGISWALGVGIKDNGDSFGWWTTTGQRCVASIDVSGNFWVNGGVTMYSDQRKKTILNHVELSLKQIANAPLIEHYYNSDEKKTTHVGSIAQYWASMNDWFCKLDSEGFYTMEIQNAALASAISIARELDRYETKTDKAIKKLKKRICELETEVERLKSA